MTNFKLFIKERDQTTKRRILDFNTTDAEIIDLFSSLNSAPQVLEKTFNVPAQGTTPPPPPPDPDKPPVVEAGDDVTVKEGVTVTLDGSASDDGTITSMKWIAPDGITLAVDPNDETKATFKAPALPSNTDLIFLNFTLRVEDDKGHISTDQAVVIVTKQGTIPPPPPPPPPPTGNVIDISSAWTVPKILTGHGEYYVDGICEARAGDNRKITFAGDKTANISGDQVRLYIHIPNYNSQLDYDVIFNGKDSTEDDCSTDLRSRHNEGEIDSEKYNRIGGIITSHEMSKWKTKRENVHGTYNTLGSGSLTSKVSNGQKHHVTYTVKDEGTKKIRIIYKINGVQQCSILDDGAPDTFFDKTTIKRKSYFRIRNNGKGSITISNVKLTILPD